jgi:phosphoglycerate dehydrogenase-like enzyme
MTRIIIAIFTLLVCSAPAAVGEEMSVGEFMTDSGVREGQIAMRDRPGWSATPSILVRHRHGVTDGLEDLVPGATIIAVAGADEAAAHRVSADIILGMCDAEVVDTADELVWVQVFSAGVDHCLDADALKSGDVVLTNMQKMSAPVIGEHAIAMMLSLARGLPRFAKAMPDGAWRRDLAAEPTMVTVSRKTVLVIGLGGIGSEVAKRAKALGMRVTATRNSSRDGPAYVDYVGLSDELMKLAADADFVVNALPLTTSTSGLLDQEFFAQLKRGSFFINVGRGGTVVTDALHGALQDGRLAGAGVDVTDPEPLPAEHPLWQMPNVIITPHVSSRGSDMLLRRTLLRENLRRYVAGEALLNVVDPERGY